MIEQLARFNFDMKNNKEQVDGYQIEIGESTFFTSLEPIENKLKQYRVIEIVTDESEC
jgi:hypothetical protein